MNLRRLLLLLLFLLLLPFSLKVRGQDTPGTRRSAEINTVTRTCDIAAAQGVVPPARTIDENR